MRPSPSTVLICPRLDIIRYRITCGHNRSYLPLLHAESHGPEGGHAPPFKLLVRICNLAGHAVALSSQIGECELGILIVTVAVALQHGCYKPGVVRFPPQHIVPVAAKTTEKDEDIVGVDLPKRQNVLNASTQPLTTDEELGVDAGKITTVVGVGAGALADDAGVTGAVVVPPPRARVISTATETGRR